MKANPTLAILDLFAQLGSGFDIVSGGELERVAADELPAVPLKQHGHELAALEFHAIRRVADHQTRVIGAEQQDLAVELYEPDYHFISLLRLLQRKHANAIVVQLQKRKALT